MTTEQEVPEETAPERPMISMNLILAVPNPEDPATVYERTMKNEDTFILLFPARTVDGKPVVVIDVAGMDPLEAGLTLRDVGLTVVDHLAPALFEANEVQP